jgi:uncharacterized protein with NRDE domain
MCTVTFIPAGDKYYITSNRDEKLLRKQAIAPAIYDEDNSRLIYPKDGEAGGSWIALNENGNAAVLLNGGIEPHISEPPYAKSRGLIFLDIIKSPAPVKHFLEMNLLNIEPFTLILFNDNTLYECKWDGSRRYCRQLKTHRPYIWSSVTLYAEDIIKKREDWFSDFILKNPIPSQADIFHFHQFTGDDDVTNNLLMNREGKYTTVSITSIAFNHEIANMDYLDLKDNHLYKTEMPLIALYKVA